MALGLPDKNTNEEQGAESSACHVD